MLFYFVRLDDLQVGVGEVSAHLHGGQVAVVSQDDRQNQDLGSVL